MAADDEKRRAIETPSELSPKALAGQSAIVTGGASGLGKAFAEALLEEDVKVLVADIDSSVGLETARELGCEFFELDVSDPVANAACVAAAVERFGGLHMTLLNAGVESPFTLGEDFDEGGYRRAMAINVDGVVFGFRAARPAIIASGGGSMLATASMAALTAMAPQPVYGASKAAVVGLARALGLAHLDEGIRFNAICPGFADTPLVTEEVRAVLQSAGVPLIEPRAVADAALRVLAGGDSGKAVVVQAGVDPYYYPFANLPRARRPADG